ERLDRGSDAQGTSGARRSRTRRFVRPLDDRAYRGRLHARLSRPAFSGRWLASTSCEAGALVPGFRRASEHDRDTATGELSGHHSLIAILLPGPNNGTRRSKTSFATVTHPALGAKSGVAMCRKMALPAPGMTGSILYPITTSKS